MTKTNNTTQDETDSVAWTVEKEARWRADHPAQALLADELMNTLGEPENLAFFRSCAMQYSEHHLREIALYVATIPRADVRTKRAVIFASLLRRWKTTPQRKRR